MTTDGLHLGGESSLIDGAMRSSRSKEDGYRAVDEMEIETNDDAEEEEDLYIAPNPYNLPEYSPRNGRPIAPENVVWLNLGEDGADHAKLKVRVCLSSGKWVYETFKLRWGRIIPGLLNLMNY